MGFPGTGSEGTSTSFPPSTLGRIRFWDIGIFFIHSTYGIDVKLVATLDPTMSAKERDTDGSYAFFVHAEPALGHLTGVPQDEIFKGNENVFPLTLVSSKEETVLPEIGAEGTVGFDVYKVGVSCTGVSTAADS